MRLWTMVLPLAMFAAMPSCGSSDAPATSGRLCTPGANVFCRCADPNSEGTKRCDDDGKAFSECDCGAVIPTDTGTIEEDTSTPPEDSMPADTMLGGEEKCPGTTVAVDPMKEKVIDGDTTSATNDTTGTGACAAAAGNDHVYAVIPTGTGRLAVKLTGTAPLDPTLIIRETDCTTGNQMACGETTGVAGTETASINVTTGKTYWIWTDAKAGTSGTYKLTLNLTTGSFCGDGTVDDGEGCDDMNKVAGDGCENDCRPTGDIAASDKCPGVTGHVWPGKTLTFSGSTDGASGSYGGGCGFGSSAQDRVYALVAHKTGTMTVELNAMFSGGFYVRRAPCETGTEIACANDVGAAVIPQTEKKSFSVTNAETVYLIVDGALAAKGSFTVKASVL